LRISHDHVDLTDMKAQIAEQAEALFQEIGVTTFQLSRHVVMNDFCVKTISFQYLSYESHSLMTPINVRSAPLEMKTNVVFPCV